jgi:hypothetical protein
MKRTIAFVLPILMLTFFSGCKLSDIRTPAMKTAIDNAGSANKAREILQTAILAHGADRWEEFETVSFQFKEQFMKLKFAAPFPKGGANVRLEYIPDSYDGRLTILDGKKKGEQWGLVDFSSWKKKAGKEMVWKHNKRTKFWLSTYQYFIQLPIKILEADYLRYGGQRSINSTSYDIVFASWKTDEPQKEFDQYALYINPESHLIDMVEYTVRGAGGSFRGMCIYENYNEVQGIQIPGVMSVLGPNVDLEKRDVFHRMEVLGTEFNKVTKEELTPEK